MKIAQVAPLYESVPPKFYGGTERVISYLTEELIAMGHEVTLFATEDSVTKAELIPMRKTAIRLDKNCEDQLASHILMLEEVAERAEQFDVIHYHIDYLHYPVSRRLKVPSLTTLHGRLNIPDLVPLYKKFSDAPVVSISRSQRKPLLGANWIGNVYHGLPRDLYSFHERPGDYFAFIGRTSPEKRVDRAIEIALKANRKIKIAAKVDPVNEEYFHTKIKPVLDHPLVDFIGEIGEAEKNDFLGNAYALLFPIDWVEPFGLVMIESMACGTPVIAFQSGSVPEVIEDGVNGYMVHSIDEAIDRLGRLTLSHRHASRAAFEARFSADRMAAEYMAIYNRLLSGCLAN